MRRSGKWNRVVIGMSTAIAMLPLYHYLLSSRTSTAQTTSLSVVQPVATNSCLGSSDPTKTSISWEKLKNPIVSFDDRSVKDMSVRLVNNNWTMMFSYIADGPFRFQVGTVQSSDWSNWSTNNVQVWDRQESGGLASPDITQMPDGTYITAFNSHTYDKKVDRETYKNKLYYRTSPDFQNWSAITPLVANVWNGKDDRLIDAALAHTSSGLIAGFKKGGSFSLAISPSGSLNGPWETIGRSDIPGGLENYQFLQIDGVWHLLGTTLDKPQGYKNEHLPALYRLDGDPKLRNTWLKWQLVGILEVPQEAWNGGEKKDDRYERSNSAFLCDARPVDGYFYLFYAGSNEGRTYNRRGHAKIGVARSRDLKTWQVP